MTDQTQPLRAAAYARQSRAKQKSIDEQTAECLADIERNGWSLVGTYSDGVSASRFGRRARGDHDKLIRDILDGAVDVVVIWSPDRADRELESWARLLNRCRDRGVLIHVVDHGRTYDLRQPRDWRSLAEDGVASAAFSDDLSRKVLRGVAGAAEKGKPPMGPCPYGYRRVYDPATGALVGQEEDPATAPIVREIITAVARSVPVSQITADLNARGVPPPGTRSSRLGSQRWYRQRVREIALNPVYIGQRRHRATGRNRTASPALYGATWLPLVDEATYYAAGRILTAPGRFTTARPGRQVHLLTYLAECYRGHPLTARHDAYICRRGCVRVNQQQTDEIVRAYLVAYLSRPDVYRSLRKATDTTDKEAARARDEAGKLRDRLDEWRRSGARGETTPATLSVVEAELSAQIAEADRRADMASLPPALRGMLGPPEVVAKRWDEATLAAKRDVIRALVEVVVSASGRDGTVPVRDRVAITRKAH